MNKNIVYYIACLIFLLTTMVHAQNGEKVFRFLNLPTSTRVNALGGNNVSLIDNDISLVFHNPAVLGEEMDMNLNFNYMSYISDISVGSTIFGKSLSPISTFAVGVNYLDYGSFKNTTEENHLLGNFSAKDIAVSGIYSRDLSTKLRGGVTTKFIYSSYESYTSTAIGFDVGLSYYHEDKSFSAGLVLKNIGAQLSSYDERRVGLPWDIQLGLTKKFAHAPIRVSLTGMYLTQWRFERIDEANGIISKDAGFVKTLFNHMIFGVDFIPTQNFWLGIGFNPKINSDMKLQEGNKWGGWNAGAGIRIQKFNVGFSFSQYHPSATAYHLSVGVDLSKF